ncbi:putative N-acetyl-gamma-glutamyl-phosphate reductase [Helianthus annuus]|nr:putative N-acetyl-gamma-glutamyl-phosphate reductase [Helianthus annuus]
MVVFVDKPKLLKARNRPVRALAISSQKADGAIKVGILGASGYTGVELIRFIANHPYFGISLMTADRKAGQSIASVFPHLITRDLPDLVAVKDADFSSVDAVFCCLPHGTTQVSKFLLSRRSYVELIAEIIKGLPSRLKIVDLSAVHLANTMFFILSILDITYNKRYLQDFRLRDVNDYNEWYGQPHKASELQVQFVLYIIVIKCARRIACRLGEKRKKSAG